MNKDNSVVQCQLDAYNARNIAAFAPCFAENVILRELQDGSLIGQGRATLRDMYSRLFESCPDLHAELLSRIEKGNIVIDHERVTGMVSGEVREAVAIYEVKDGIIQQVWFA